MLQEPGSYVGEVVKVMGKKKVLVKVSGRLARAERRARGDGERGTNTDGLCFARRCTRRESTCVIWTRASMSRN